MPNVRAESRAVYSVDVACDDLEHFRPEDPENVGFLVTAATGPKDAEGAEVFDVFVCTPRWLIDNVPAGGYAWGRHKLVLPRWDHAALMAAPYELCAAGTGPTWDEVADRLARFAAWKFEDARPPTASLVLAE